MVGEKTEATLQAVVTSPPWENQEGANAARKHADPAAVARARAEGYASGRLKGNYASPEAIERSLWKADSEVYGDTPGQIGRESSDTYWSACAEVYRQVHLALKPGGIMAVVVKAYVKQGKIVDLPGDTCKLLESIGFQVFERTRCWLVKHDDHPSLFGGVERKTKSRKSFFRRLAEAKGSPRIDWEEVLWVRR